jgi:hypothetical protein
LDLAGTIKSPLNKVDKRTTGKVVSPLRLALPSRASR